MSHNVELSTKLAQAIVPEQEPITLDEAGTRLLRRLVAEAIVRDFDQRMKEAIGHFSAIVADEINLCLQSAIADVRRSLVQHEEIHHPATGPDGQLSETSAAALFLKVETMVDRHLTDAHQYGAIGELVDFAVSYRFEEYGRFLTTSAANREISRVAAQIDAEIDDELSAASEAVEAGA